MLLSGPEVALLPRNVHRKEVPGAGAGIAAQRPDRRQGGPHQGGGRRLLPVGGHDQRHRAQHLHFAGAIIPLFVNEPTLHVAGALLRGNHAC